MKSFAFLRKNRMALGRQGESFAADYLERNGFTILARNWRTNAGELDIVARKERESILLKLKPCITKRDSLPPGISLSNRDGGIFLREESFLLCWAVRILRRILI